MSDNYDRICAVIKCGIGRGGWAYSRHAMHMVAALAGCRMAGPFLTVLAHGCRNHSSPIGTISNTVGSFQSSRALAGMIALTIESSVMSGHGQGREPPKIAS